MSSDPTFTDPALKAALIRETDRVTVDPSLQASVESLFSQAAPGNAAADARPASLPLFRNRLLLAAAALLVLAIALPLFLIRSQHHEDEYTIAEERLWPALASLHHPANASNTPAMVSGPKLDDPRYQLIATRADKIETVDCNVTNYRRSDGATFSLITTPASNLLREPEEEADETYDETVGGIRIVGGIKGDQWICVAAPVGAPSDLFDDVLSHFSSSHSAK